MSNQNFIYVKPSQKKSINQKPWVGGLGCLGWGFNIGFNIGMGWAFGPMSFMFELRFSLLSRPAKVALEVILIKPTNV